MINKKIGGLLGLARKAGKVVFGTEGTMEAIRRKQVKLIIVAQDAAPRTKKNFMQIAEQMQIPISIYGTIEELSNCIGQQNKAILGIKEIHFSEEIIKIMNNGGEMIG
ncbi:MAG: L7Ae/L30e/S12e/Gadd45 family ribosomal protein [Clostridia bacterium]